ncbi:MATE family efflux transporter [Clostridia bacterium]|nr:MATE family efflux transporter [Clostridia bacterium]
MTENKMGTMPVRKLLFEMSIPMMISMLVQALYNIVDSMFVARISEDAFTAVTLAFPIQSLMISLAVGTGVGINAVLSRSLGEKNFGNANKSAMNGIFLAIISTIAFMIFGVFGSKAFFRAQTDILPIVEMGHNYLFVILVGAVSLFAQVTLERLLISTGKTVYSMITQLTGAIVNVILDPILIFGLLGCPAMGVRGAAIATVIAGLVGASLALYFNLTKNREITFSFAGFRPDWQIIKKIYVVGIPSILSQSLMSITQFLMNGIILKFSTSAVAVLGSLMRINGFVFMPVFGLNNAMIPIISYNYGAKKKERMMETLKTGLIAATGILFVGFAIYEIFPNSLLYIFSATPEMLAIGGSAFRIMGIAFLLFSVNVILPSVFQALGHGSKTIMISLVQRLFALIPVALILARFGNVNYVWWAYVAAEACAFGLCIYVWRGVYEKEIKTLVDNTAET